jgi:hypothetical protein
MMDIEQNGWIGGTTQIERDDFLRIVIPLYLLI